MVLVFKWEENCQELVPAMPSYAVMGPDMIYKRIGQIFFVKTLHFNDTFVYLAPDDPSLSPAYSR